MDKNRCCNRERQQHYTMPTITTETDRYFVGNRVAVAISTVTLLEYIYDIKNSEDSSQIIDYHKI